jgi:hypothetical protein
VWTRLEIKDAITAELQINVLRRTSSALSEPKAMPNNGPGANPTTAGPNPSTASYNASDVKIYNSTSSLVRSENQKIVLAY